VFPDRIEIASPGHLPNKLTVEQAKSGNSIPRNPILQSMAAKLMPYRGIGTGIPRALKAYPHIEFYNDPEGNRFRSVILRRASQV
jgi:ATP-dependent DNA helicase RecG